MHGSPLRKTALLLIFVLREVDMLLSFFVMASSVSN